MIGSSKRTVMLGIVLLLVVAACGDDAADPERFCEIVDEIDNLGDPFELSPDETRAVVDEARDLLAESASVAPDEVRPSFELWRDEFEPFFDLFEAAGYDSSQIDDAALDAAFTAISTDESDASYDAMQAWIDANCST